jgi:signal transduction histidine kinase
VATLSDRLRQAVVRALAARRGEVRANQDFRFAGEVARLTAVFAITMLLPIAFLAFLSLTSLRWEELSIEADLEARGRATTQGLQDQTSLVFSRFEDQTLARLRRGESATDNLGDLSPHLRAAFRFDEDGRLAAPFVLEEEDPEPSPTAGWWERVRVARAADDAGTPDERIAAWRAVEVVAGAPSWAGEARLGVARALADAGRGPEASRVAGDVISDLGTVRDPRGFRYGHLAFLELARFRLARNDPSDAEAARSILEDLVDSLLQEPWSVGSEAEPTVVRRALRELAPLAPPDWLAERRSRLAERQAQLRWANSVRNELELVYVRLPEGTFRYVGGGPDSPGVWAILQSKGQLYAFSFSVEALLGELRASAQRTTELEPDLQVRVVTADVVPGNAMAWRSLGPALPGASVFVVPKDPEALARAVGWRRTVRLAVVLTSVFVSAVGALWVARLVVLERETARQRAEFAANVSHELRSPITQIRLKGEALLLGLAEEGEDTVRHYEAIVREAERLSRLVDDVLDFAAIERGVKRYHVRPEDVGAVVAAAVESSRAELTRLGMTVELEVEPQLPRLLLDRDALGQVVTNLLSNAGKYAPDGKWVGVSARRVEGSVVVAVTDRGIGIAANELPKVFDDFFRSTDPRVRRTKGTGIGLAIVRYIVEAHGGTITVESELGKGSRFVVQLPVPPSDQPEP